MINLLEVAERLRTGEKMDVKSYDLGLFRKTQELTKRHNLAQTGKPEFWDVDNAYADALFVAGVDYLAEWGAYCVTTERAVKFTEDEVRRAAREIPSRIVVGQGSDTRTIRKRDIEDSVNRPSIVVAGHSAWSDQVPVPIHIATREMVADDRVDVIQGYMYAETDRYEISDPAHWAYAARRAVERVRNGCTQAGRPGLCVVQYPTLTRAFALIAAMDPYHGLRPTDGTMFSIQPDVHIETDYVAASYVYEEYGLAYKENQGGGANFIADIYGSMIISVASRLAAWICYRDNVQGGGGAAEPRGPQRDWGGGSSVSELVTGERARKYDSNWLNFAGYKALHRNTGLITKANIWGCHEAAVEQLSEEFLLMQAISAMRETLWGNNFHFAGSANPPTVIRWPIDVSDAVMRSRLTLRDYQELTNRIVRERLREWQDLSRIRDQRMKAYESPSHLLDVQLEVYDFYKGKISQKYLENEKRVRSYLKDLGLDLRA
jgi:hypothetical protein